MKNFREKAHNLEMKPSSETWHRLEEQLGPAKAPKKKIFPIRYWAVAASLALLIGVIYLSPIGKPTTTAVAAKSMAPTEVTIIYNTPSDYVEYYAKVAEIKKSGLLYN